MGKHALERIEFGLEPSKQWGEYGMSHIDGRCYHRFFSIGGKRFANDGMHFKTFYDMLEKPGDYWPFCCSLCGMDGCDGIFVPIRCIHRGDEIILIVREPMYDSCNDCGTYCSVDRWKDFLRCPKYHFKYRAHRVKKSQMREALEALERRSTPA